MMRNRNRQGGSWRTLFALTLALLALASHGAVPALTPWNGGAAPGLALEDVYGVAHDLSKYRGQVVLINFWATC